MSDDEARKAVIRDKLIALRQALEGIDASIAELAGAAFNRETVSAIGPGFINGFEQSFTDGGGWYDTFANAPTADIGALSVMATSELSDITLSALSETELKNVTISIVAKPQSEGQ